MPLDSGLLAVAIGFFCLFSIVFWEAMSLNEELFIELVNSIENSSTYTNVNKF